MSRYPGSSRRLLGAALLPACSALSLLACAHAVDNGAADTASDATAGATSSGGSAEGGSASAGLGNASGSGDLAGQAQGGAASDDAGAPGSAGQVAFAGAGGAAAGGNSAGGAKNSAGAGNAGRGGNSASGGSVGSAGSVAAGGGSGGHLCKVTTDQNVYTPSNTGCGGYAACKGQIHWRNDEAQTLTKIVLSFSEPAGTTCIDDNATSKWTIADNGATSHRCVFTASGTPVTVVSKSALSFGYDTNQTGSTAPTDISVTDPSCN
jgi:hypothetical protein